MQISSDVKEFEMTPGVTDHKIEYRHVGSENTTQKSITTTGSKIE